MERERQIGSEIVGKVQRVGVGEVYIYILLREKKRGREGAR